MWINRDPFAIIVYGRAMPNILGRILGRIFDIPIGGTPPAVAFFYFVFLIPELKGNVPVLKHELKHIKQKWQLLRYGDPDRCLKIEVEAYREQLKWCASPESDAWAFAYGLSHGYNMHISTEEAHDLLTRDN